MVMKINQPRYRQIFRADIEGAELTMMIWKEVTGALVGLGAVPVANLARVDRYVRTRKMPVLKVPGAQGSSFSFAPVYQIDTKGADQAEVDRFQHVLEKTNCEMEARTIQTVRQFGP